MTLRLTLALAAICWLFLLANAWAGCGGPEPTHLPTCHPVKLYALKYWSYDPDGYVIGTPDLTLAECNEARKHFHVRGAELEREAADKNWKKHPPYCAPM
jgi:hypothetical protein